MLIRQLAQGRQFSHRLARGRERPLLLGLHDAGEFLIVKCGKLVRLEHAQLIVVLIHQRLVLLELHYQFLDLPVNCKKCVSAFGVALQQIIVLRVKASDHREGRLLNSYDLLCKAVKDIACKLRHEEAG